MWAHHSRIDGAKLLLSNRFFPCFLAVFFHFLRGFGNLPLFFGALG